MGYSAQSIQTQPLTIKREDIHTFDLLLDRVEAETGIGGHISWCGDMKAVRTRNAFHTTKTVMEVLRDYGFEDVEEQDNGDIVIGCWGGDKIGSSWDPMWNALGEVIKHQAYWVMMGEDGDLWGEAIVPGRGRLQFGLGDHLANLDPEELYDKHKQSLIQ